MRISLQTGVIVSGLALISLAWHMTAARADDPQPSAISEEAGAAVAQMGKSLQGSQFSFQARTLRVYADTGDEPLHIVHAMKVTVRRPDRLLVDVTGDDGSTKAVYDGKTMILYGVEAKKYITIPAPNTIQAMLETVMGRLGVDFPLADFLTDTPDRSILQGVTAGKQVNTVTIDGVPCRHLLFTQPPGIELELWVEENDRSLPRRLIATYRSQPNQPAFVAELFDWNFNVHPTDAEFVFTPPEGAVQVEAKHSDAAPTGEKRVGSK